MALGESKKRVNFRIPSDLMNAVDRQVVLEKQMASEHKMAVEPKTTDVIILLLRMGLEARQAEIRDLSGQRKTASDRVV